MLLSVERPFVGAFALQKPRATLLYRNGLVQAVLPASDWNMCKRTIVVPQELGRSCYLLGKLPDGAPGYQLQAQAAHSSAWERKKTSASEVSPSEGNEVRRDGQQEVIAS